MGNRRVRIGMCVSVCGDLYLLTRRRKNKKKSAGDSAMIPTYVCDLSASNDSDCNMIVKRIALLMCLCAWIWNHSSGLTGLAYDD